MKRILSAMMVAAVGVGLTPAGCDEIASTEEAVVRNAADGPTLTPIPPNPVEQLAVDNGRAVIPASFYYPRVEAVRAIEGRPAPPLSVQNWHGESAALSDLKGKVVLVDFWGVWCPPCMRALPKNNDLYDTYRDQGLEIIGVHTPKGAEGMSATADRLGIQYPVGVDAGGRTGQAWGVRFYPTYAAVDRQGIIRAIGLRPDKVEPVIKALLAEGDTAPSPPAATNTSAAPASIPAHWLEGPAKRGRLAALTASTSPPALQSDTWINSEPLNLEDLKGKVVVLDFWGTWCPPCIRSIPKNNHLHDTYKDQGLVLIGVCEQKNVERMGSVVQRHDMRYPTCADDGSMVAAYKVDGFPDYYLIDRQGRLRIADCANGQVEAAIKMLLAEPAG